MKTLKRLVTHVIELFISAAIYILKKINKVLYLSAKKEIPIQNTVQEKVLLNDLSDFVFFASIAISNAEKTTITGDCGVCPDSSIEGFPPGIIKGFLYLNDEKAKKAKLNLIKVYHEISGRTCNDIVTLSGNLSGLTLTPGLYKSDSSLDLSFLDLVFDACGNKNAVFIIQIASSLNVKSKCKIILKREASASHIFWLIGDSATIGTASFFKGTILAMQSIEFFKGAKLEGRAFSIHGSVFLTGNTIVKQ